MSAGNGRLGDTQLFLKVWKPFQGKPSYCLQQMALNDDQQPTKLQTESFRPTFLSIHGVLHWFAFMQALQSSSDLSVLADDAPGVVPVQATSELRAEFRQVCGTVDGLGGTERRAGEGEVHESCPQADR
ncbi:hypothetical protein C4D60_Mb04t27510 [Musa balbisiana]|uniref:Uncharacterized protein n=1 Tax=Musa balbisiana TaxID=52838 RepID=A0A4S8KF72_MUSBA|nr:hypothetical protein C4D60_Mb04t27510 [Musa balbisiana]